MALKRTLFRIGIAMGMAVILAVVAGFFILRSRAFHRYVLAEIAAKAAQVTGSRVMIGDFAFRLSGLRVDLYRVTLYGSGPSGAPPLFTADRLVLGLRIASMLHQKIGLNSVAVDHPVVHIVINKPGQTNLPRPSSSSKPGAALNVFSLAVRHAVIDHGDIFFNDVQTPLDAALQDLQVQIRLVSSAPEYEGTLSYRQGIVRVDGFNPLEHNLRAAFKATESGMKIERLLAVSGASRISMEARLTDYEHPSVEGTYQIVASGRQIGDLLKDRALPTGEMVTTGSFRYRNLHHRPLIQCVMIDGQFKSSGLVLRTSQAGAAIRDVRAQYQLEAGNLKVSGLRAKLLEGSIAASASALHLTATPEFRIAASIHTISLGAINSDLASHPLQGVPLRGQIDGMIEAAWQGKVADATVRSDITIRAATPSAPTGAAIPVSGAIHLRYDGERGVLSLRESYFRTPASEVRLNGTLSDHSWLSVSASTSNLHEIDQLALILRRTMASRQAGPRAARLLGLQGSAALSGDVQGSIRNPTFAGQLRASNVQFRNVRARLAGAQIAFNPSHITLSNGELMMSKRSGVHFRLAAGLSNWSYTRCSPVNVELDAAHIRINDLESLANRRYPVEGILDANLSVHGSQLNPSGQGTIQLTHAQVYSQPVQKLVLRFTGTGNAIRSTVSVQIPAGTASGNVSYYPRTEGYGAQLAARDIRLGQLEALQRRHLAWRGSLSFTAQGRGTFRSPQLTASVQIPALAIGQQQINSVRAQLDVANQEASFTLSSGISSARLNASGNVSLKSDYWATGKLDAQGIPVAALLAGYLPGEPAGLHAQASIEASVSGPLKYPARMQAQVEVPTLSVSYQSVKLANAAPIRADYSKGILVLQPAEIKGPGTDLKLRGAVPIQSAAPVDVSASGAVNLAVLQTLSPGGSSISGQLKLQIDARGARSHPQIRGAIQIVNATYQSPGFPVGVEKLNGDFALDGNRVEIKQLAGVAGGGVVSARGSLTFHPHVQFNIGLTAKRVRVRYQQSVRIVVDSSLALAGTRQTSTLSGRVLIDSLSLMPSFDLTSFLSQMNGAPLAPPSQGFEQNLKLNIAVQSTRELKLQSSALSLQGSANLAVRGTAAEPVVLGRATVAGGELYFLSNRYQVQRGSIDFVNPVETEPIVNLLVSTTVEQYDLSVNLVGPVDHLTATYLSNPPLPQADIINLLAGGQTTEEASAQSSAFGLMGAESILAQGVAGQVSGAISKFTGLSSLTIDPTVGGNLQNPGARLAIQKRVTKNLMFTISTDVDSTEDAIIQVQYQVTPKVSVSAVRNEYGAYGINIKFRKNF